MTSRLQPTCAVDALELVYSATPAWGGCLDGGPCTAKGRMKGGSSERGLAQGILRVAVARDLALGPVIEAAGQSGPHVAKPGRQLVLVLLLLLLSKGRALCDARLQFSVRAC